MSAPRRRSASSAPLPEQLAAVNLNAAAVDVGSMEHWVAVPPDRDPQPVRSFSAFTADLVHLVAWLVACGIDTVCLESTGNYWIPLFDMLEAKGLTVLLVDPRRLKQVPGRKSDIRDCQWLQQLLTFGLLSKAFRPAADILVLRTYTRQRAKLVACAAQQIQAMQNALTLMNLKLQHVVDDISGVTGMAIIRSIVAGERDPQELAKLRDYRCKNDADTIASSLHGFWRDDHLFLLRQALDSFDHFQTQIASCDLLINSTIDSFPQIVDPATLPPRKRKSKRDRKSRPGDVRKELFRITGVDLFSINGIDEGNALTLVSEIGTDMSPWATVKHFTSWLGLCPAHNISGGKILRRGTRPNANRAALAFRLGAASLHRSDSALGAFFRRKRAHLGAPKAITATAHKIARNYYYALKNGIDYVDAGEQWYEQQHRSRQLKRVAREAARLGMVLVPKSPSTPEQPVPASA